MECIIHYSGFKSCSKLKPVSSINKEAVLKANSVRASKSVVDKTIIGNSATA